MLANIAEYSVGKTYDAVKVIFSCGTIYSRYLGITSNNAACSSRAHPVTSVDRKLWIRSPAVATKSVWVFVANFAVRACWTVTENLYGNLSWIRYVIWKGCCIVFAISSCCGKLHWLSVVFSYQSVYFSSWNNALKIYVWRALYEVEKFACQVD